MKQKIKPYAQSDDQYEVIQLTEQQWRCNKIHLSPLEELEIFEATPKLIEMKISEWQLELDTQTDLIKSRLTILQNEEQDEFIRWFVREWIKLSDGVYILEIKKRISKLKHQLFLLKPNSDTSKEQAFQIKLEHAREVPLEQILSHFAQLKRRGRTFVTCCPFHGEKTPSFTIYPETNHAWCYGCQKGFDSISVTRLYYNLNFIEAVEFLNNN